jgi:tellurite methyltransferase
MAGGDRARWDARYRDRGPEHGADPSPVLVALDDLLPRRGYALDVAGGAGRNACWLARRGLDVTIADVSPVGLELARAAAAAAGLTLRLVETDLEIDPLPGGPYDLIVSIDFLCRALFAAFPAALVPGGLLVYSQPTRTNLERHPHPSASLLLEPGELRSLVGDLEVLRYEEGWFGDRHEARVVARKP